MGPPRRARSNSSVSNHNPNPHQTRQRQTHPIPQYPQPQLPVIPNHNPSPIPNARPTSSLGMSPASRYASNMKVVRRRDPSIVSIFDQFSHVCVYHHNGDKWEKQGYEGSMFLYERDSYPPYGFYILNRVGMDDYIQRLYPEDSIGAHGSYLMMRSYPDFTAHRLAALPPPSPSSKFAREYAISDTLSDAEKGRSQTVGLWCYSTDARESMTDVLLRLHSYIKRSLPYPEEFRYGPERPPPPNFRSSSRASDHAHVRSNSSASNSSIHSISESEEDAGGGNRTTRNAVSSSIAPPSKPSNASISELDKLFAKLGNGNSAMIAPPKGSEKTTEELFAGLCGTTTSAGPPARGLALLDTIFASATPPPRLHSESPSHSKSSVTPTHTIAQSTAFTQSPHILSPKPTSTTLPQVLNQEVIFELLGLPPSRASSVSSNSNSHSRYPYEGDNEASDDGYSVSSTVLDADADENAELQAAGSSSGVPLLAIDGDEEGDFSGGGGGRVLGDVTPRPALRGFGSDMSVVSQRLSAQNHISHFTSPFNSSPLLQTPSTNSMTTPTSNSNSTFTATAANSAANATSIPNSALTRRALVPFTADSELWPYPRAPLLESDDSSDVVELDFADTSALSDPEVFSERERRARGARENEKKGRRQKNGKKGMSREERERERDEIERSWDVPENMRVHSPPPPPPPPVQAQAPLPVMNGKPAQIRNGRADSISQLPPNSTIDSAAVRASLVSTLALKTGGGLNGMSRNDFVREVLTLIHTDKQFVDTLWQDYSAQAN
ncbi:hypothetical protein BV22DRAFT_1199552 [Leucogyrophana mollusca]|uniref:Uncharacterized protein n=1 Tax=Leucogyrophana mollusca TaxID=85980 RepID=A0ACB8B2F6_9AGAM|nr:hypothetical protein BV22DRAFT_1199552 [Leucogyrophana mollusca]